MQNVPSFFADRWEMPARFRAPGPAGAAGCAGAGISRVPESLLMMGRKTGGLLFLMRSRGSRMESVNGDRACAKMDGDNGKTKTKYF